MYKIHIPFLDLNKMFNSGQCFSWTKIDENTYFIVDGSCSTKVKALENEWFEFSCDEERFNEYWYNYFDMDTDYGSIILKVHSALGSLSDDGYSFLWNSLRYGYGIRVLNQDTWQTMVTFMISQNNNMKRIRKSVDKLRHDYGFKISGTDQYYFPTVLQLTNARFEECGCGYRSEYLREMCDFFYENDLSNTFIKNMNTLPTINLETLLMEFKGCGKKVASCIMLYGLHRLEIAPIDVHMKRIIDTYFDGINPLTNFHGYEGIVQQWIFDYQTHDKH